jgi:flagellar basal-body rod protein FlgB
MALLGRSLNLRASRHDVLSSNIANIETPGYRARDIKFEEELRKADGGARSTVLASTHPGHIAPDTGRSSNPEVFMVSNDSGSLDQNSVGVDSQMVKLSANSMMYSVAARFMKYKFARLMTAIKG